MDVDKMISNKLFQSLVLPIVFLGLFTAGKYFTEQYSAYGYNQPLYYGQYGYGSTRGGPYYQGGPYPLLSTSCNSIYGCRTSYSSQIYVRNALDYTYYTHPWLLEPRYMSNHQRYVRGTGAQMFWY